MEYRLHFQFSKKFKVKENAEMHGRNPSQTLNKKKLHVRNEKEGAKK